MPPQYDQEENGRFSSLLRNPIIVTLVLILLGVLVVVLCGWNMGIFSLLAILVGIFGYPRIRNYLKPQPSMDTYINDRVMRFAGFMANQGMNFNVRQDNIEARTIPAMNFTLLRFVAENKVIIWDDKQDRYAGIEMGTMEQVMKRLYKYRDLYRFYETGTNELRKRKPPLPTPYPQELNEEKPLSGPMEEKPFGYNEVTE